LIITEFGPAIKVDKSKIIPAPDNSTVKNTEVDWAPFSGAIKFQGVCGSCYAFATADAVGAMYTLFKFNFNVALSVQQIMDCSRNGLTYGCEGGFLEGAYSYIQTNGITTDYQYKYTGIAGICKINSGTFKITQFRNLPKGDCVSLINELFKKPVAVGIAARKLKNYSSGVFNDCDKYIDHAVLLVGFKLGSGWKIKNTWGSTWGINGYAWIKEGDTCGICQNAVSATIAE
jgi:C1A family cysteine protease